MDDRGPSGEPDAWIVFKLSDAPLQTEHDGDFHVLALMDAASGYILHTELMPVLSRELPIAAMRRLLQAGASQVRALPAQLLVSSRLPCTKLQNEAARIGLALRHVDDASLSTFTAEPCADFRARFGGGVQ